MFCGLQYPMDGEELEEIYNTFRVWGCNYYYYYFKEINTFIQQGLVDCNKIFLFFNESCFFHILFIK